LLKATTYYSPIQNPERSKERRNVVLQNLVEHQVFSQETCDSLKNIPIQLNYGREETYDGIALHFRAYLAKYLEDWEKLSGYDIYADGLRIHVTLDSRLQRYAEEAVEKQMKAVQKRFFDHWRGQNPWRDENKIEIQDFVENIARKTKSYRAWQKKFGDNEDSIFHYLNIPRKTKVFEYKTGAKDTTLSVMDSIRYMNHFMHTGFVAMEPNSGNVKAWVGDINFDFWQYDKVAQSKRQPGSTFKLFVYTAAMMHGLSPCDYRTDQPVRWDYMENGQPKTWQPNNVDYTYRGNVTLKYAFARSINTIAVQLAKEVGIEAVIQAAHLLGIKTKLEDKPSTCLGSSDVSLLELVNSFGTIVNEGIQTEPVLVTRIEDADGHVIFKAENKSKRVIPYETAWLMTEMLKGGMTEPGGTTQALWEWNLFNYDTNFGGKTGTSSNHSDAWFVGVTKNLIGGAWVGGEQRSVHFRTGQLGEGSRTALPIFGLFMEKVLKDEEFKHYRGQFAVKPKQTITRKYKCHTYIPVDTTSVDTTITITSAPEETEVMPVEN
jgi:penicillin-binding protein 1A